MSNPDAAPSTPTCSRHGLVLEATATRFGARLGCPYPGCTMVAWDKATSTPADPETRRLRSACHLAFDGLWANKLPAGPSFPSRSHAYRWLAEFMHLPLHLAHIGMFDAAQCRRLLCVLGNFADRVVHDGAAGFQAAMDDPVARPDPTPYLVYADYLADRDDPRADGYRALARTGLRPYRGIGDALGIWYAADRRSERDPPSDMPEVWFRALRPDPNCVVSPGLVNLRRHYQTTTHARDAAAVAWCFLDQADRDWVIQLRG